MIVTNASQQGSALSSMLQGAHSQVNTAASPAQDATDTLTALAAQGDPDQAQTLQDQQSQLKDALAKLQSSITDSREARKQAAADKVARIKAQIQALRMSGGDPKVVAKQAARLAHDLASAAKEYAAAGGSASTGAAAAPAAGAANNNAAAGTSAATSDPASVSGPDAPEADAAPDSQDSADAQSQTGGETPPLSIATGSSSDASIGAAESEAAAVQARADKAAASGTADVADPSDASADAATSTHDQVQQRMAASQKEFSSREEDRDFVRKVREMMNELKSIVDRQKTRLHNQGDTGRNRDLDQADDALRDTAASLHDIAAGSVPTASYVDIAV